MERNYSLKFDPVRVTTPSFVVDKGCLRHNLKILDYVKKRSGCKILLAVKGFAMFRVFPLLRETLDGICASSPHEACLGRDEFGREVHTFAAAYSRSDIAEVIKFSDHIIFNSFAQWNRFKGVVKESDKNISCGIRVNPEHSEGAVSIYDPCAFGSRLGVLQRDFDTEQLSGITGLHFHTLCEHGADALERTVKAFENIFGKYLKTLLWVNFGGGHHITKEGYDLDLLCEIINSVKKKYGVEVYLEPGEAVAFNAGVLVASVLDIVKNDMDIAILDTSAAAHMPDVLEVPYRPFVIGSGLAKEKLYTCRLAGHSCLAGDIIGEYSFDRPLKTGDRLVFTDMAHYSMVKTTTFNGLRLPSIFLYEPEDDCLELIKEFGYDDYKMRLS